MARWGLCFSFAGKLIAATNRDLAEEIRSGRFREDFYYRLCADTISTPSLHEQLGGSEDEPQHLVRFISARVAGDEEAGALTDEVMCAIEVSPGFAYRWPGNFRELGQCVRSVMLRGSYEPRRKSSDPHTRIAQSMIAGDFTADELLCTTARCCMQERATTARSRRH